MKKYAFSIFLAVLMAGCASPYKSEGFFGGHSETQYAPDIFRVNFRGNAYTSDERAQNFALLRAAELTVQKGFKYFMIIEDVSSCDVYAYTSPGSATTTGSTTGTANFYGNTGHYHGISSSQTTYKPPQTHLITKPRAGFFIKCFNVKPNQATPALDATFLIQSLKQKYNIKS